MAAKRHPFIVVEALDAGGSQTQTNRLAERLGQAPYEVLQLHFPQEDRATGRLIYDKFLLSGRAATFSRREQALLYIQDFFARADEIASWRQRPGHVVVSDRFCTSTFAYQTIGLTGRARQAMIDWLTWLCFDGTPALPRPDVVVFIDTPVAVSLQRLRDKKRDFFETQQKLTAIRRSYLRTADEQGWHIVSGVDAKGVERTRDELAAQIWQLVEPRL